MVSGPVNMQIERRRHDTLLSAAGVPLGKREYYYGLHLNDLASGRSVVATAATGLMIVATSIAGIDRKWAAARHDKPPQQIVGVTHWSLARVAHLAGFNCTKLDRAVFDERKNAKVGWNEYADRVEESYTEKTLAGRSGKPVAFGVIFKSVPEFVEQWHIANLSPTQKRVIDPVLGAKYLLTNRHDAEAPSYASPDGA